MLRETIFCCMSLVSHVQEKEVVVCKLYNLSMLYFYVLTFSHIGSSWNDVQNSVTTTVILQSFESPWQRYLKLLLSLWKLKIWNEVSGWWGTLHASDGILQFITTWFRIMERCSDKVSFCSFIIFWLRHESSLLCSTRLSKRHQQRRRERSSSLNHQYITQTLCYIPRRSKSGVEWATSKCCILLLLVILTMNFIV